MFLSKEVKCIKIGGEYYNGLWNKKIMTTLDKELCLGTNSPIKELERIKKVIKKKQNQKYANADLKVINY